MQMKIALAGNPNCGKTTMFNDLTGSSQYVGNWPGVTVEKKEGRLKPIFFHIFFQQGRGGCKYWGFKGFSTFPHFFSLLLLSSKKFIFSF